MHALAIVLGLAAAWSLVRGIRLFVHALRCADDPSASLWLVRGIRGIVVAVGAAALTSGLLLGEAWLVVFGALFLAEELYETGVLVLVLRHDASRSTRSGRSDRCAPCCSR